jgi:hypothetical protein
MLRRWNKVARLARKAIGCLTVHASLLALAWVLLNLGLGWIGVATGHPNAAALIAGAFDGTIISGIVLVKASARLEAGMTGLLSGFGFDSITNGGHTVARFVHGVHDVLETIINVSADDLQPGHHQALELMLMRAIWVALTVILLALFVKWGQNREAAPAAEPMPTLVQVPPPEMARGQAA